MHVQAEHRLEQLKRATDRIQREIEEVTEREHELRNVGSIKTTSHETVDFKVHRMPQALASGKLKRTTSTPQILETVSPTSRSPNLTPKMTNGVISTRTTPTPLRFATTPSQKGLMHRFLATRGKLYKSKSQNDDNLSSPITPVITLNPLSIKAFNRTLEIPLEPDDEPKKPLTRKGYVPVEQKIQKELHDMKERENELRYQRAFSLDYNVCKLIKLIRVNLVLSSRLMRSLMLAKSQPNLLDIGNDNDSDIYDGSSSLRSGTSTNTLNEDEIEREHKGKHKRVIESTKNWSLKMTSLYYRCSSESNNKRTINRSMKQTQSLINDYNDVKVPTARRMDLFFASGMRPIWMLEEKWANLMFSFGDVKTALEVFIKLELWEDVIVCYNVLNLKHKAVEIIEQEISKKPTVKLWCLLGDATGNVSHYEVAWKLSDEKSSKVQKHWGLYYFAKKNYVEAIPHLKLSVELNNIQEDVWFRLGYAALQIEDWKLAAMAYKRYCSLEQFAFEAWNNLAKAYIKLGDKATAWKFLQDAIASCYDCWQVWDNLMIVSIDLGHFSELNLYIKYILLIVLNNLMSFAGKVVLITGASSGIGAATAVHLAQLGASLSISGRNKDNLEKVAEQCGQSKPFIVTGELTNENDVKNIIDSTIKHYGKLDVLVNNAGILTNGSIETTNLEQYDKIFNVNVRSVYQLTTLAVPHLIKTKGNIVNISSVNGLRSFPGCLAYCMSKAALDQFTRCVALDLASKQVRVNAVNPGVIVTNLHETSGMDKDQLKNFFERGKQTHALGRTGNVSEVAKTIAFLASDEASFITGATLPVDGGRHAMCPR
ncbi:Tetratricopeptide repeat protein 27 [Trachymyrmex cornetzi]|uniref:Tetratricopeptide repeat protein 27 n=1 Tax=Trachymyrmex cornetzi TaxID=471704 RepID=A0A195DLL3_9HYME|nr:Tetratricopeptide repeat protein 27 [Trachymyrmex cornetzi]